ncbi:ABC transporter permease [Paraburkholderia phymatum]|uniref:Binding-protein-dependent transport systems inner membrane component n=1 Tax=Paraburkholderia phymatum (strain DSM 17167 / CIP 108236 / LMG 21445 / STM815) TaxID=391038 RepID=B2JUR1_PARP8|nr:ABC transporter permease [Paraburkholderia phymatum]ACC76232.1 binding-protein-dependent transport systems inner membrane component [Paraburkholderia phymatum STM815]
MSFTRSLSPSRIFAPRKAGGPPPCSCDVPVKRPLSAAVRKRLSAINWRGFVLPLAAFASWWIVSALHVVKSGLLVSPVDVAHTAWQQIQSGALLRALSASLAREASGFVIGTAGGLLLGAALGFSRIATRLIGPTFDTFKQISLFAWIPLISVWFGLGDMAKVVFLSLAALLPVAAHTCDGIHAVPPRYVEVARAFRYSRIQMARHVILPAALPSIFTGIYLALIYSWLATLGAEYLLVAGSGIGNTLIDGSEQFRMDLVLFGIIVVGFTGSALNALARSIERRLFARRGRPSREPAAA